MMYPCLDGPDRAQLSTFDYATPSGMLRLERALQTIYWEDGPIESWRHTDSHGHAHAYRNGYPTLRGVVDEWCHVEHGLYGGYDEEGHAAASHYECRDCGERIDPAHGPGSKVIPVREDYSLDGELISKRRFYELVNADMARRAAEEQAQAARKVARQLGYPPDFTEPPL